MGWEWIAPAKDVVLAIAAGFTAFVAVRGINRWRYELEGKASFDTARALARAVYRYRDAMKDARAPMIHSGEFNDPPAFGQSQTPRDRAASYWNVYQSRLRRVQETLPELDAAALEAEALWGGEVRSAVDQLRHMHVQLWAAMQASVSDMETNGETFKQDQAFGQRIRSELARSPDDSDPMSTKIVTLVSSIETLLKPHLRRT